MNLYISRTSPSHSWEMHGVIFQILEKRTARPFLAGKNENAESTSQSSYVDKLPTFPIGPKDEENAQYFFWNRTISRAFTSRIQNRSSMEQSAGSPCIEKEQTCRNCQNEQFLF
jgi:hypothetical protein